MTANPDVALLEEGFAAFSRGDFQKAISMFHEECEWVDAPELPGASTYRGRDEILACWASWTDVWGEVTMEPTEYVEAGGGVYLVPQRMRATGAASGTPIEMTLWSVVSFKDGKPRRVTYHLDEEEARRVAGLVP